MQPDRDHRQPHEPPLRAPRSNAETFEPRALFARARRLFDKVPQSQSFKKFLRAIEGPAEERGKAEGEAKGEAQGIRVAVLDACELLGLVVTEAQRAQLEAMGVAELETLRHELKQTRRWPGSCRSPEVWADFGRAARD